VIAATLNLTSRLRPTSQCHPDDYKAIVYKGEGANDGERAAMAREARERGVIAPRLRGWAPPPKPCSTPMRAREGFLVCEMTNHSNRPAFVYVQLNRGGFLRRHGTDRPDDRLFSAFFRVSHLTMGH